MRISEIYLSVQGEGPRVGEPTVFIRFAGCNLRCAGWPCDTLHAIDPEKYRQEWKQMSVEEIAEEVTNLSWELMQFNVCLTGGEPFLQNEEDLKELTDQLYKRGAAVVECFSNGTLLYPEWVNDLNGIYLIMDWKLPSSGEACDDPTRIANLKRLAKGGGHSIKFVIGDRRDYEQAKLLYGDYVEDSYFSGEVYYGVVWNKLTNSELISWVLEDGLPWRLNVQVHNYIWDRRKRGI